MNKTATIDPSFICVIWLVEIQMADFLVYPNSSDNIINIEPNNMKGYLYVYNYATHGVYEQSFPEVKSIQLNVSSFKTGIYIIKFLNSAGESFTRKVAVAR